MTDTPEKRIDRYLVQTKLCGSNFAVVYKALDSRLNREVAIKLFRPELFSSSIQDQLPENFVSYATSLVNLSHPFIVNVLDFGKYGHSPYLVMEYLPGNSLRHRMGQPFLYFQAAEVLKPIAQALSFSHSMGFVHGNVKPDNVLFSQDGIPKLVSTHRVANNG